MKVTRRNLAILGAAVGLFATACTAVGAVEPTSAGEVVVVLRDNRITPAVIKVKAGQRVRFVIENRGRHVHEFMVGRNPMPGDDYLEEDVWVPFGEDFWEGIDVQVSGTGMPMNFEGMEPMAMGDMGDGEGMGDMGEGDGMSGGEGGAEMGDGHDEGGDMGGMDMGEEAHHGAMVMLAPGDPAGTEPGEVSIIEFVVPADKVGTWQIGCFQEAGQHFEDGMRATLIVEA